MFMGGDVTIGIHEIVPGIEAHMFFNGSYPGPVLRVKENEWVQVDAPHTGGPPDTAAA